MDIEYGDLSDPSNCWPFQQQDKDARAHLAMVINVLSRNHGVVCLSKSWRAILMWAHYGDNHKGLCLGFEIDDTPFLSKIEYVSKRLPSWIDFSEKLGGVEEPMPTKSLNVKHRGWRYEKERRLRVKQKTMSAITSSTTPSTARWDRGKRSRCALHGGHCRCGRGGWEARRRRDGLDCPCRTRVVQHVYRQGKGDAHGSTEPHEMPGKWELTPAYDLTPNPLVSQEKRDLAIACGRFNR
jgi:hypothetical protein